jgi:hypothetical protein
MRSLFKQRNYISFDDDDSRWLRRDVKPSTPFIVKAIVWLLVATAVYIFGAAVFLVAGGMLTALSHH